MEKWTKEEKNQILRGKDKERLEKLHTAIAESEWRTQFHVQTVTGLMNDPNGFSYFNGKWHLFYQWFPFGAVHGMKHWYHCVSDDLVNWENVGLGIRPESVYENGGCFSGCGFVKKDELYLTYTANHYDADGTNREYQVQAVMNKEGVITKVEEPLIYPRKGYTRHQRDPKVFEADGKYWILHGAQTDEKTGKFLLFRSDNISTGWEFQGELKVRGYESFGFMVECPDIEKIGDKWLLLFSPQGYGAEGDAFRNKYHNVYFIGDLDLENLEFIPDGPFKELDRGFDFYASQCACQDVYENAAVLAGWFGCSDYSYPVTDEQGWAGLITMPRKLTIENGKLMQRPVDTWEKLKGEVLFEANENGIVKDRMLGQTPRACIMDLKNPNNSSVDLNLFSTVLRKGFAISYDRNRKLLTIDRGDLEHQCNTEFGTDRKVTLENDLTSLLVFVDHSTVELFVNDGEYVLSSRIFPTEEEHLIRMRGKDISLTIYEANTTVKDDFKI